MTNASKMPVIDANTASELLAIAATWALEAAVWPR